MLTVICQCRTWMWSRESWTIHSLAVSIQFQSTANWSRSSDGWIVRSFESVRCCSLLEVTVAKVEKLDQIDWSELGWAECIHLQIVWRRISGNFSFLLKSNTVNCERTVGWRQYMTIMRMSSFTFFIRLDVWRWFGRVKSLPLIASSNSSFIATRYFSNLARNLRRIIVV